MMIHFDRIKKPLPAIACAILFITTMMNVHGQTNLEPGVKVEVGNAVPDEVATKLMSVPIYNFAVHNIAFSPDGKTLGTGDGDGNVRLWEVATGKLRAKIPAHTNWAFSVAWSRDGGHFATGGGDALVQWFDAATPNQPVHTFRGHQNDAHAVVITPDAKRIISAGDDRRIIVWDISSGKAERDWQAHAKQIPALALSPDGEVLASGSRDHTIALWDWRAGRRRDTLIGHTEDVLSVRFSPDGKQLASASYDTTVRLWDVATGKAVRIYHGHTNRAFCVAFSPDGKQLGSAGDSTIWLHEVATGKALRVISPGGQMTSGAGSQPEILSSVAFAPDGSSLAVASTTGVTYLFSTAEGKLIRQFLEQEPK